MRWVGLLAVMAALMAAPWPARAQDAELAGYQAATRALAAVLADDAARARDPAAWSEASKAAAVEVRAARGRLSRAMAPYIRIRRTALDKLRLVESSTAAHPRNKERVAAAIRRDLGTIAPETTALAEALDQQIQLMELAGPEGMQKLGVKLVVPGAEGVAGLALDRFNDLFLDMASDATAGADGCPRVDFGRVVTGLKAVRQMLAWARTGAEADPLANPEFDRLLAMVGTADLALEPAGALPPVTALRLQLEVNATILQAMAQPLRDLRAANILYNLNNLEFTASHSEDDRGPDPQAWRLRDDLPFHDVYLPSDTTFEHDHLTHHRARFVAGERPRFFFTFGKGVPRPVFTCVKLGPQGQPAAPCDLPPGSGLSQEQHLDTAGYLHMRSLPPPGEYLLLWSDRRGEALNRLRFSVGSAWLAIPWPGGPRDLYPGERFKADWMVQRGSRGGDPVFLAVARRGAPDRVAFNAPDILSRTPVADSGVGGLWTAPSVKGDFELRLAVQGQDGLVTLDRQPFSTSLELEPLDLQGRWLGHGYACSPRVDPQLMDIQPESDIEVPQFYRRVVATKVEGDNCIPSGEVTWKGLIVEGGRQIQAELHVNGIGAPMSNASWTAGGIAIISRDELSGFGLRWTRVQPGDPPPPAASPAPTPAPDEPATPSRTPG